VTTPDNPGTKLSTLFFFSFLSQLGGVRKDWELGEKEANKNRKGWSQGRTRALGLPTLIIPSTNRRGVDLAAISGASSPKKFSLGLVTLPETWEMPLSHCLCAHCLCAG
jgi:hypothetical protein